VGSYISRACQGSQNTVCSTCTHCGDLQYPATICELGHDAICASCQQCFIADAAVRAYCNNDRYRWWASLNCCKDIDGNQVGGVQMVCIKAVLMPLIQVRCNLVDRQNMYITSRNGRHHWAFHKTSPPIDDSGAYALGKTWPL
jgi:hypothetical protein